MRDLESVIRQAAQRKEDGATDGEVVAWLGIETHVGGIEAFYVAMRALKLGLREAKELFATHPAWRGRFSGPCETLID